MELEIFILFIGVYVLIIGMFYHHWLMGMRLIEFHESDTKILERIENMTAEIVGKRKVTGHEDTMKKIIGRGMELEGKE